MTKWLERNDFEKHGRIFNETLATSSESYPNRLKVPITSMKNETVIL